MDGYSVQFPVVSGKVKGAQQPTNLQAGRQWLAAQDRAPAERLVLRQDAFWTDVAEVVPVNHFMEGPDARPSSLGYDATGAGRFFIRRGINQREQQRQAGWLNLAPCYRLARYTEGPWRVAASGPVKMQAVVTRARTETPGDPLTTLITVLERTRALPLTEMIIAAADARIFFDPTLSIPILRGQDTSFETSRVEAYRQTVRDFLGVIGEPAQRQFWAAYEASDHDESARRRAILDDPRHAAVFLHHQLLQLRCSELAIEKGRRERQAQAQRHGTLAAKVTAQALAEPNEDKRLGLQSLADKASERAEQGRLEVEALDRRRESARSSLTMLAKDLRFALDASIDRPQRSSEFSAPERLTLALGRGNQPEGPEQFIEYVSSLGENETAFCPVGIWGVQVGQYDVVDNSAFLAFRKIGDDQLELIIADPNTKATHRNVSRLRALVANAERLQGDAAREELQAASQAALYRRTVAAHVPLDALEACSMSDVLTVRRVTLGQLRAAEFMAPFRRACSAYSKSVNPRNNAMPFEFRPPPAAHVYSRLNAALAGLKTVGLEVRVPAEIRCRKLGRTAPQRAERAAAAFRDYVLMTVGQAKGLSDPIASARDRKVRAAAASLRDRRALVPQSFLDNHDLLARCIAQIAHLDRDGGITPTNVVPFVEAGKVHDCDHRALIDYCSAARTAHTSLGRPLHKQVEPWVALSVEDGLALFEAKPPQPRKPEAPPKPLQSAGAQAKAPAAEAEDRTGEPTSASAEIGPLGPVSTPVGVAEPQAAEPQAAELEELDEDWEVVLDPRHLYGPRMVRLAVADLAEFTTDDRTTFVRRDSERGSVYFCRDPQYRVHATIHEGDRDRFGIHLTFERPGRAAKPHIWFSLKDATVRRLSRNPEPARDEEAALLAAAEQILPALRARLLSGCERHYRLLLESRWLSEALN